MFVVQSKSVVLGCYFKENKKMKINFAPALTAVSPSKTKNNVLKFKKFQNNLQNNYGKNIYGHSYKQGENYANSREIIKNYNISTINFTSKKFDLGEDFEEITLDNIENVLPLYEKYQKGMNQKVDREKLSQFIKDELEGQSQIFSIKQDGENVGFIHFSLTRSTIDMCPFFTIQSVFVDENQRGKGLAKKLVNKVKDYSVFKNYKGIFVKTLAKNESSMNMYRNLDFKDESTKYGVFFWANDNVLDYKKGYVNTK